MTNFHLDRLYKQTYVGAAAWKPENDQEKLYLSHPKCPNIWLKIHVKAQVQNKLVAF